MKPEIKLIRRGNKLFIVFPDNSSDLAFNCADFDNANICNYNSYENGLEINLGKKK
jgi:hypothetical protein